MAISSVTSSSFSPSSLAKQLRLSFTDSLQKDGFIKKGLTGSFRFLQNRLFLTPDPRSTTKESNHVTTTRRVGNKFSAKVNVTLEDHTGQSRKDAGFILKKQDDKNYLSMSISTKQDVRFYRVVNGEKSLIKTVSLDEQIPKNFDMQVDVNNSNFDFYMNGKKLLSAKDSTFSGGELGFGSFHGLGSFSDLEIYQ
ncbi:MAG: hypothetical protein COB02_01645 [Candidatus Cloacimonadota bacterium]|nr:MAG: hypothetical protein COB02_01645 [Candidatus Cloacimonadota bacterium]